MAKIVAAATISHSPLMNIVPEDADPDKIERYRTTALDLGKKIKAIDPDLIIVFGQDHQRSFFMDHLPAFCIGVERVVGWADYRTPKGPFENHPELARHILSSLMNSGIEPSQSYDLRVDHGITQPMQLLGLPESLPFVPILLNTAINPMPRIRRCFKLGRLVEAAISSWAEDLRVVVIGSGGLSHSPPLPSMEDVKPGDEEFEFLVHGHRFVESDAEAREQRLLAGYRKFIDFINPEWDEAFIEEFISGNILELADRLDRDQDKFIEQAGPGGHELRTWIATAGATNDQQLKWHKLIYEPIPSLITGMGIASTIA